jgi:hypothetical protein
VQVRCKVHCKVHGKDTASEARIILAVRYNPGYRRSHPGYQLGVMPPHSRLASAKVEQELAPGTSGGREPARNRMLTSWQGVATAKDVVLPGCGSWRLRWR